MDKLISELLILPERARKGDFVLNLSRGEGILGGIIGAPGTRIKNYVLCPRNSDPLKTNTFSRRTLGLTPCLPALGLQFLLRPVQH